MPLYRKRRFQRPGLPELVAVAAVIAAITAAVAWLDAATAPTLEQTSGRIVSCDIRLTHYNAASDLSKVFVDYAYSAGIGTYTGHWEGFWPSTKSPDALPPDKLDLLKSPGRTITVFYDPADPRKSFLHNPATRFPALYALAAIATALAALIYLVRIYPAWKR
ncbi:MAG TPA: DUF3592 domain-containing protein [Candidatus Bathyarchaeia archaeon]|nr:DUF3592 domain-containing protein [Candidatus Bathyarchaeia archaeon]